MTTGSINTIETMGLVDGPGIRTIIFLNGCKLRCKYCHNPEMFNLQDENYTVEQVVAKVKRYKPYYKKHGGVTFSGGEPLLQSKFIIECSKLLKKEQINIALDTSGVGINKKLTEEVVNNVDIILFDIKDYREKQYQELTSYNIKDSLDFIETLNKTNKKVWIRQVIIPDFNDNEEYLKGLKKFISNIKNVERIDFLPYHRLGIDKYKKLNIKYSYQNKKDMDKTKCNELYEKYLKI